MSHDFIRFLRGEEKSELSQLHVILWAHNARWIPLLRERLEELTRTYKETPVLLFEGFSTPDFNQEMGDFGRKLTETFINSPEWPRIYAIGQLDETEFNRLMELAEKHQNLIESLKRIFEVDNWEEYGVDLISKLIETTRQIHSLTNQRLIDQINVVTAHIQSAPIVVILGANHTEVPFRLECSYEFLLNSRVGCHPQRCHQGLFDKLGITQNVTGDPPSLLEIKWALWSWFAEKFLSTCIREIRPSNENNNDLKSFEERCLLISGWVETEQNARESEDPLNFLRSITEQGEGSLWEALCYELSQRLSDFTGLDLSSDSIHFVNTLIQKLKDLNTSLAQETEG